MSSSLPSGARLGRYEIKSQLGAGGMGEVYLAQDPKLDRKVALKILPADVAAHQDRMKRFVQEAKSASALNHPNIITIYEIEQIDSVNFIATEFIDGETLRPRLKNGPLKLGEVLDVAAQIASALSTAHAAGIVHRDIKPENIMLRRDGIVKVLDFGLAKLLDEKPAPDARDLTVGAVLGTLGKGGRNKVTLITSPGIGDLGAWLEQLLAESTGKEGKGILPVAGEPPRKGTCVKSESFDAGPLATALAGLSNDNAQGEYYLPDVFPALREAGYGGPVWRIPHPAWPDEVVEPGVLLRVGGDGVRTQAEFYRKVWSRGSAGAEPCPSAHAHVTVDCAPAGWWCWRSASACSAPTATCWKAVACRCCVCSTSTLRSRDRAECQAGRACRR